MKFPSHINLTLSHNEHAAYYQTVAERLEGNPDFFDDEDWVSAEQKQKAIDTNEMWTLQWYPVTPIGFCLLHAADLDVLLRAIENIESEAPDV